MPHSIQVFSLKETAIMGGAFLWAFLVSDYVRDVFETPHRTEGWGAEALIGFGLWCLFLWWLSKRYSGGWTFYWFVFALVVYAPFADAIDGAFGGILGLRQ